MSLHSLMALTLIVPFLLGATAAQGEIKIQTAGQDSAPQSNNQPDSQIGEPSPAGQDEDPPPQPPEAVPVDYDYYAVLNGAQVGPMKRAEVDRMIGEGAIERDTLMWRKGLDNWQKAESLTEITWIEDRASATERNERIRNFLLGTWRVEYVEDGHRFREHTTIVIDGTYTVRVEASGIGAPSASINSGKGNWDVEAINDEAFYLIFTTPKDGKQAIKLQVLDQDRMYQSASHEIYYRVN